MSLVFWRSVNGYMYPSNLGAPNGAGTTTAYYPYLSAAAHGAGHHAAPAGPATAPAGACQALAPLSGAGPTTIPSALALAAAAAGTPTAAATPAHKWMMPGYMSSQQMYMFLPKINKPKTERVNKAVKCDICNLTLNSELQAQQHYNGKNHLKKMKQLGMPLPGEDEGKKVIQQYTSEANSEGNEDSSQGDGPELGQVNQSEETDGSQQGSIEDASESPPSGPQTQQLTPSEGEPSQQEQQQMEQPQELQQQQPQTATSTSPAATTTEQQQQQQKLDPVSQAVYDNILGKLPRKRKMEIPCCVCDMIFNSEAQASQHFRGVKHAKRLKMSEDFKTSPPKSCSDGEVSPDGTSPSESKSSSFFCQYCGVALNSTQQLEEHREGQLHKKMVERKSGSGNQTRRASEDGLGGQSGLMHCKVCDIRVPSPSKFQQHLSSSEHAERMQGRPLVDEAPDSPASSSSSSTTQHQQC